MDKPLHSALRRQARRAGIANLDQAPDEASWKDFVRRIDQSYEAHDRDRYLLERSQEISNLEMKSLHSNLNTEKERLQLVLDALPRGIIYLDSSWNILLYNEASKTMFSGAVCDPSGHNLWNTIALSTHPKLQTEAIKRVLSMGRVWRENDCQMHRLDKSRFPANVTFHPMVCEQLELQGITVTIEDITEYKQTQRDMEDARVEANTAERARHAQASFLAHMSHELRTPLNTIIGYSELVWEEANDLGYKNLSTDLDKINNAGKHLLALINNVLDMSKIQAGHMEVEIREFSPSSILKEVSQSLQVAMDKNNNAFVISIEDSDILIQSDNTKLKQALINLASNAAKFTSNGIVSLSQHATMYKREPAIEFVIEDTGIGIAPDILPNLFKAFVQADHSITRRFGGTGLGLAITKSISETLHGKLTVHSEVGVGTTFRLVLPCIWPQNAIKLEHTFEESIVTDPKNSLSTLKRKRSILLIDTNTTCQEIMTRYMKSSAFDLVIAESAEQAINLTQDIHPELIIIDPLLPHMEGRHLISLLKQNLDDTPVFVLSSLAQEARTYILEAQEYLTKPIRKQTLLELIEFHTSDPQKAFLRAESK